MSKRTVKRAPTLREGQHWLINAATGCWEWTGRTERGYARCITGQASREVWRQSGKDLDADFDLHHVCLTRVCVNPAHLEPRRHGQHQADHHRGFSVEQVRLIRQLRGEGLTHREIAARFGVYWSTISKVLSGENYAGVR